MSQLIEICLWFCAKCGHVTASQRRLPSGAATIQQECLICKEETTHSPVAIQLPGPMQNIKFVTRKA